MKYMKYCGCLALAGIMAGMSGCASTIDSLSNNTSSDMVRGVKLQAGVDASSGTPVPSVTFTMGSLARKGKGDRTVVVIDNNTTDIVNESYHVDITYGTVTTDTKDPRQLITKEVRTPVTGQLDEGIFVNQTSQFGMGVTAGNLFSAGGGTMISIGKVGTNTPQAILSAKIKPQDVGPITKVLSEITNAKNPATATGAAQPGNAAPPTK